MTQKTNGFLIASKRVNALRSIMVDSSLIIALIPCLIEQQTRQNDDHKTDKHEQVRHIVRG